jgi:hypothetical protein
MDFIIWLSVLASMLKACIDWLATRSNPVVSCTSGSGYQIDFPLKPIVASLRSPLQAPHHLQLECQVLLRLVPVLLRENFGQEREITLLPPD